MSCNWLDPEATRRAVGYLEESFGISPAAMGGHRLLRRGEYIYAVRREASAGCEALTWVSAGLPLLKVSGSGTLRPVSRAVQVFGRLARRRVAEVTVGQLRALVGGSAIPWEGEEGPVILCREGSPLGIGLIRGGRLVSQLPRSVTEHLRLEIPRERID